MRVDLVLIREIADAIRPLCDDNETYLDTLDGEVDVLDIIDREIAAMQDDGHMIAALKDYVAALSVRRSRLEARVETRRAGMLKLMHAINIKKVERPLATLSVRAGSVFVGIEDEADVPTQLKRVKKIVEPDKQAIMALLKAGEDVPGASLQTGPETLMVRT